MDSKHNSKNTTNALAKLKERRRALDARIDRTEKREAKARRAVEQRQNFLIGACVRKAAEKSPKLQEWLSKALNRFLTTTADRKTCAPFLLENLSSSEADRTTDNSENEDGP